MKIIPVPEIPLLNYLAAFVRLVEPSIDRREILAIQDLRVDDSRDTHNIPFPQPLPPDGIDRPPAEVLVVKKMVTEVRGHYSALRIIYYWGIKGDKAYILLARSEQL